jgi:putative addiction module killer protein
MRQTWELVFWTESEEKRGPVWEWLQGLPRAQKDTVVRKLSILELCGNTLRMPTSRALGAGLFELREKGFGLRLYYGFLGGRVVLLVAGGDKGSQQRDIRTARQRLNQALEDEK